MKGEAIPTNARRSGLRVGRRLEPPDIGGVVGCDDAAALDHRCPCVEAPGQATRRASTSHVGPKDEPPRSPGEPGLADRYAFPRSGAHSVRPVWRSVIHHRWGHAPVASTGRLSMPSRTSGRGRHRCPRRCQRRSFARWDPPWTESSRRARCSDQPTSSVGARGRNDRFTARCGSTARSDGARP